MLSKETVENSIKSILSENGVSKSRVRIIPGKTATLEICVDRNGEAVDLDFCEMLSRQISDVLDQIDQSNDSYMLDVCSFGAEMELESVEEIRNNIGNYVHVELRNPKNGLDTVEGYLTDMSQDQITVEYKQKNLNKKALIELDNIRMIRLAVKL